MQCVIPTQISSRKLALFLAAFIQALFGGLTLVFKDEIFQKILESQLVVREGTEAFRAWKETPIPVYTKFWFYSILNPEDFLENHAKPILIEKGPYVFREKEEKVGLVWNLNHTVSYQRRKFWWFEPEMSVGPLSDTVMTLNLPLVGAAEASRENYFMQWGLADIFATMEAKLFINKTVGELLFDGYEDELIAIGDAYAEEEEVSVPLDKFAWFYQRNGTTWSDGNLIMHTGEDDISLLGRIDKWNYETTTSAFPGECGKVQGSADGLFAPGTLIMENEFKIWSTDTCRTLNFERSGSDSVHGIYADKFQLSRTVFANKTECSDNSCYNNNLPSGVQNVTQCKMKSPAFVSRPHFYNADRFYVDQFQYGIKPDAERHESHFLIEPKSSIPLEVSMKLQLNILLDANPGIDYIFKDLQRVFYPVLWFESEAKLPESMAGQLSLLVNLPVIMDACGIAGIVLGLFTMLFVIYCTVRNSSAQKKPGLATCEYAKVSLKEAGDGQGVYVPPIIKTHLRNMSISRM